jgi:hypothetical protein
MAVVGSLGQPTGRSDPGNGLDDLGQRTIARRMRGEVQQPAAYPQATVHLLAVCKTVGSAYVGSNPTPATHLRRSKPVTPDGVTGFCVQNERLRKPSALFRGLCVGRIRASPGLRGYRLRCRLSCGNARGSGYLRAVLRVGRARWPWAARGTEDRFAYI